MGNPFFDFYNTDGIAPTKKFRSVVIYHFVRKLLSKPNLDLRKGPNQKTHESESVGFLVWALPIHMAPKTNIISLGLLFFLVPMFLSDKVF